MLRDDGGVIVPMFNNYIDATNARSAAGSMIRSAN